MRTNLWIFLFLFILVAITGCTVHERRGYSTIPQNRPAHWETNPYGFGNR